MAYLRSVEKETAQAPLMLCSVMVGSV